ncbi:MAG: DUF975 family protein [Bacteroidales bacterium]|nr:DUF975 family protein [Bacteroidales bacterium]
MTPNIVIMGRAKAALQGGWLMAAVAALIMAAICVVADCIPFVPFLIAGPFSYGFCVYLIRQLDYGESDLNLLFTGFSARFLPFMIAGLLVSLAISIGTVLLIVPGIIVGLGFSMTFLIMIDNPQITGIDAMKASWKMMEGHKWELFCLYLRFIGWILLGILTAGILMLWVAPYMQMATILFYRDLRSQTATPPPFTHISY